MNKMGIWGITIGVFFAGLLIGYYATLQSSAPSVNDELTTDATNDE